MNEQIEQFEQTLFNETMNFILTAIISYREGFEGAWAEILEAAEVWAVVTDNELLGDLTEDYLAAVDTGDYVVQFGVFNAIVAVLEVETAKD